MSNANPSPPTRFSESNQPFELDGNLSPLAQVRRMQRVIFNATQTEGVDKRELAQLACAWERLEERKRVMCGKPAPKPVDVSELGKRKRRERATAWEPKRMPGSAPIAPEQPK